MWNRARPALVDQAWSGNAFMVTRMNAERPHENVPITFTSGLPDYHLLRPNVVAIPIRLKAEASSSLPNGQAALPFGSTDTQPPVQANLGEAAREYLAGLEIIGVDEDAERAALLWMHVLAIGHTPAYLTENRDGVQRDWPRIPLPASRELLEASAALGREVAALLDTEAEVAGVTTGTIRPELRAIGAVASASGRALDPAAGDLAVTAGWGHPGKGGITMPGRGRLLERAYTAAERDAIARGAAALGLTGDQALALLGETCCDVFLNERAHWRCVPASVWTYTIGGYQVIKKWLSYRERDLLGRDLTSDEARHVTAMTRRIAALVLLQPQLDASYAAVKSATYPWPGRGGVATE
jgi:hypothetical protein